jgi:hypothetical protein
MLEEKKFVSCDFFLDKYLLQIHHNYTNEMVVQMLVFLNIFFQVVIILMYQQYVHHHDQQV